MKRLKRRIAKILLRLLELTDPRLVVRPNRLPPQGGTVGAPPPAIQRRIPLPAGTPRHHTVSTNTSVPPVPEGELWPGMNPPEVRRS